MYIFCIAGLASCRWLPLSSNVRPHNMVSYLRLHQSSPEHFSMFCQVFQLAPTYVYASEGHVPTQDELRAMYNTSAPGVSTEDIFIYGLFLNEKLSGC